MKIKIKVNKSKSKNNLSTAGNCHSKQKKAKLICSWPGTAIQKERNESFGGSASLAFVYNLVPRLRGFFDNLAPFRKNH